MHRRVAGRIGRVDHAFEGRTGLAVAVTSVGFGRVAQLRFDEGMVDVLEVVNHRRDIVRRRHLVHEALAAQPGERILDVGCGPGFFVAELLDAVGSEGWVTGVDMEPTMLAVAAKRTEGHDNVAFYQAQATSLPVPDGMFDAAASVQVLEYVQDVSAALAEIHRALCPGGRVVVGTSTGRRSRGTPPIRGECGGCSMRGTDT
jgi:ubiquinone/menaquinone biosynthesis C-methylase UbiE